MTNARFYFRFRVRDLFVASEVLGLEQLGEIDGREVRLRLPADALLFEPDSAPSPKGLDLPEQTVGTVQVSVDSALPFGATDTPSDYRLAVELSGEFQVNLSIATGVVRALVEWSRVDLDQIGLGVADEFPPLMEFQRVLDLDSGSFYNQRIAHLGQASFRPNSARPVGTSFLESLLRDGEPGEPPIAHSLLADARHLAGRQPPDWLRAVLVAAIATEVRVKEALKDAAAPESALLLDLVIESPRDVSLAAVSLFDKAMKAVTGHSLREEDSTLYKDVVHLFEARNRIAHRAMRPSAEEGQRAVDAAYRAFGWLDRTASRAN